MPDGYSPLDIQVETPGLSSEIAARMARNEARSLPDAIPHRSCIIVSSGPSARSEALWERLSDARLGGDPERIPVVALNGALSLFGDRDLSPDYWACCDPQDLVNDFVPLDPPRGLTYLLATKCPENLFNRLKTHIVETWRVAEPDIPETPGLMHVPTAVSITLVAQSLMRFKGFTRFEHYGWDCCYVDGRHHACDQPEPPVERLTFDLRDGTPEEPGPLIAQYDINGSWLAELKDAITQAHNMRVMGYSIVVHGNGLVANALAMRGLAETPDVKWPK